MAGTTIGRMAVVLTSDTTRFDAGFGKAASTVSRFRSQVDSGGLPMLNLGRATSVAKAAIGGLNGNMLGLVGNLSKVGGTVAVSGALIVGLGLLAKKAIEARDAIAVMRGEESLSGEWKKLQENATGLLATLGEITGLHRAAVNEAGTWERILGRVNEFLKTDDMRKREDSFRRQTAFLKEQKRIEEERAAADKAASEATKHWLAEMRGRAEHVSKALRTPGEIFADTVSELNGLFGLGMLSVEQLQRGTAKARDDLKEAADEAAKAVKKFQDNALRPVAAAERFTQAGVSAVNEGRAQQQKMIDLQREAASRDKIRNKLLEDGFKALQAKPPASFIRGRF